MPHSVPACEELHERARRNPLSWARAAWINFWVALVATATIATFTRLGTWSDVFRIFITCFIFSFTIGILAAVVLSRFAREPESLPFPLGWLLLIGEILGVTLVGVVVANAVLLGLHVQTRVRFWPDLFTTLKFSVILAVTVGMGMYFYETNRLRLRWAEMELQRRQLDEERALKLAAEARLSSLESRIHPHFLFNTLNSIAALIHEDPPRAEEMVEKLAALLRFALDANQHSLVPLRQEEQVVRDYLEIERARFGERLRYSIQFDEAARAVLVPPLSLQTLVENAVKFAVAPRREGGLIRIDGRVAGGCLELSVQDDGGGFPPGAVKPGHGIDNLQARLAALFGAAGRLCLDGAVRGKCVVTLSMPAPRVEEVHVS